MLSRLASLWRTLTHRRHFEDSMQEELRFHIEQYTRDLERSGLTPAEATRLARLEFGPMAATEEECREARGLRLFDTFTRTLRYAFRSLRRSPSFTATALSTLALCIGANLTLFAVLDAILLRPLPFPAPTRLVTIYNTYPVAGVLRDGASVANYYERRGTIPAFQSVSLYRPGSAIAGESGFTEREPVLRITPDFFSTLGIAPAMGRNFKDEETTFQSAPAVIVSDAYWRNHAGSDPNILSRTIRIDGISHRIVAVLPPSFRFLSSEARLFLPLASPPEQRSSTQRHSGGNSTHMIARLNSGFTLAQAQAQIDAQNAILESSSPFAKMMADAGFRSVVVNLQADHVASIRTLLILLQLGALTLLLIAAVNLTNLFLIRSGARLRELSVRRALGASPLQVFGDVFMETQLVCVLGAFLGLALGIAVLHLFETTGAALLPLGTTVQPDARLICAAALLSLLLGILISTPVTWFHLRHHPAAALTSENRSATASHHAQRLRDLFLVCQVALALILLTAAGLFTRSLDRAMAQSPGFSPESVWTARLALPHSSYPDTAAQLNLSGRLLERFSRLPGVHSAALTSNIPFSGDSGKSAAAVSGHTPQPGESPRGRYSYSVDGDYFSAMGIPLRSGRYLTAADSRRGHRVCVVDEDFAREYWPGGNALGQQIFQGPLAGPPTEAFSIVGVVGSVKQSGLTQTESQGAIYYPLAFRAQLNFFLVLRTSAGLNPSILQSIVREVDADLPLTAIRPIADNISDSLAAQRIPAFLAIFFSAAATLLTALGTFGVVSYAVAQRRREIGLRIALGAQPRQIRLQFLTLTLRSLAIGGLLGLTGAILLSRTIESALFAASGSTLPLFLQSAALLILISLLASLLPAQRAAQLPPAETLQSN